MRRSARFGTSIHAQVFHVSGVDLVQPTMPYGAVVAPVSEPVLLLFECVDQAFIRDLLTAHRGRQRQAGNCNSDAAHHRMPSGLLTLAPAFTSPRKLTRYAIRFCKSS